MEPTKNFVRAKLEEWGLAVLSETFEENCIDDKESFELLNDDVLKELIPKVGLRLKFTAKLKSFRQANQPSSAQTSEQQSAEVESSEPLSVQTSLTPSSPTVTETSTDSTGSDDELSPPPQKKSKPASHDLRSVILDTPRGENIVEALDKDSLTNKQRKELTRILVSHLMVLHGSRPSTNQKAALAKLFIEEFPSQKDSEGEGYEAWFCRGTGNNQSTGYLEQRLRNVRKRSNLCVSRKGKEVNPSSSSKKQNIPESEISMERRLEMKAWLKHNNAPADQVVTFMQATVGMRAEWIRENPDLTSLQIKTEYPRLLDTPGMIEQDFAVLYGGETADGFITKWDAHKDRIYAYAQTQGSGWKQQLGIHSDTPLDDVSLVALQLLPCILPTGLVKNRNGKMVRATKMESLSSFIDVQPVGTNLPGYLNQRHEGLRAIQPSVLVLGTRQEPSQSFVIVDGLAIEAHSLLKAVDICFKAFYVLDVCYPKECNTTWEFFQKFFFKMGEGKGKSVTSSGVRSLRTFIEKK